jgi:hypothetical protein
LQQTDLPMGVVLIPSFSSRHIIPGPRGHTSAMGSRGLRAHGPVGSSLSSIQNDRDMLFALIGSPSTRGISVQSAARCCRRLVVMATRRHVKRISVSASKAPPGGDAPRLLRGVPLRTHPIQCGCYRSWPTKRTASTKMAASKNAPSAWKNTRWEKLWRG